jgi:glucose dehydrogenase
MSLKRISYLAAASALATVALAQGPAWDENGWHTRQRVSHDPNDWPMYNHDVHGTRFNKGERRLSVESVPKLQQKWVYSTAGDVYATPVVVDDLVYAGDTSGTVYALTRNGLPIWQSSVKGAITASALVTNRMVILGDQLGYVYGLDRRDGRIVWSMRPNPNPYAAIYGEVSQMSECGHE